MYQKQRLRVHIGTWNVGDEPPKAEELIHWLPKSPDIDLYAVGVQEGGYQPRGQYPTASDDWAAVMSAHLGDEYVPLAYLSITPFTTDTYLNPDDFKKAVAAGKAQLGEIRLGIYAKLTLLELLDSNVTEVQKTCGRLDGLSGNKGGLGVHLKLGETRFTFINAHLNAHDEFFERRNEDCFHILSAMNHPQFEDLEITKAHYTFFFGDLNYRIKYPLEKTLTLIQAKEWPTLACIEGDQLKDQQYKGNALCQFEEFPIQFAPTFKVTRGTTECVYNKSRIPSYCDRILYVTAPAAHLVNLHYSSCPEVTTSDHKPVCGTFEVEASVASQELKRMSYSDPNLSFVVVLEQLMVNELHPEVISSFNEMLREQNEVNLQLDAYIECLGVVNNSCSPPRSITKNDVSKLESAPTLEGKKIFWNQATNPPPLLILKVKGVPFQLLQDDSVFIAFRDENHTEKLGEAFLPLVLLNPQPQPLSLPLYQRGLKYATLNCTAKFLRWK